jgi:hypothetical protein
MRTRTVRFGLYADEQGLAWVKGLVAEAVGARSARIVRATVAHTFPGSGSTTADVYDHLAEQWEWEHREQWRPGSGRAARPPGLFPADVAGDPQDSDQQVVP